MDKDIQKIKILLIVNELLNTCGVSKHLLYFLNGMQEQKEFEFSILCGGGDATKKYKNLCKEIIIDRRFKHENRSIYNFIHSIFNLYRIVKRNRYNIIHSHHHYAANICHIACFLTKAKDMHTIHGIIPEIGKLNHFSGKLIVCVNEHIIDYISENKLKTKEKVKLIRYGIGNFELRRKNNYDKLRIIAASRIVPEKGLDIFIKAISLLPETARIKAEFMIAGKGTFEQQIKKLDNELNTGVNFIGEVKDLIKILQSTDIFILPTLSDSEGLPLTLIEAAMSKNLIISSRYRGINPVFSKTLEPLLFEKGNIQDLADKIEYSINNYGECENIINHLYREVKKEFSVEKITNDMINLYREFA